MLLHPTIALRSVRQIDKALLDRIGVQALLLDLDNTLTLHGEQELRPGIGEWLTAMRADGIPLILISNNSKERIAPFANRHKLPYIPRGCKPLTFAFTRAQKKLGFARDTIAVVGDQLFTDILGGNLAGMRTILVQPFEKESGTFFRMKRGLERRILGDIIEKEVES